MPQKVIKFKGINRSVNEYNTSGECEELINLRQKADGGCKVVKPKKEIYNYIAYEKYYEHTFGDKHNQIAILNGEVFWLNSPNGKVSVTKEFVGKNISISFAGNIMLIYCNDEANQEVYEFKDDEYSQYLLYMRPITDVKVEYGNGVTLTTENPYFAPEASGYDRNVNSANMVLASAVSEFYNENPNGLCGAVLFGMTYELEDGTELWSTAFTSVDFTNSNGYVVPQMLSYGERLQIKGTNKIKLTISFEGNKSINVKRVNIYSSSPIMPYEFTSNLLTVYAVRNNISKDGHLMYYQGSVNPDQDTVTFVPKFGNNLLGEKVMDVLPGCIERLGEVVSYNNRFHYYNNLVYHAIQNPTSSSGNNEDSGYYWIPYVYIEGKWYLAGDLRSINPDIKNDFIYPMAGVSKLRFVQAYKVDGGEDGSPYAKAFTVELKDSQAYNYSYAFDVVPEVVSLPESFYNSLVANDQVWSDEFEHGQKVIFKKETNTINVSDQFNPYSFQVKYSYSFSGNVLDLVTSYLPISSVQIGQYPLTVFTSNGIFALEQGDGAVLYSNTIPIQPHVAKGKSLSTPHGTFFFSSDNLYLLSGREAISVSEIMQGRLEENLNNTQSYRSLCLSNEGDAYDFSELMSRVEFKDFVSNASLTYDPLQDEVIISNQDTTVIPYSYVLNVPSKSYHKIDRRYSQFQNGARYVLTDSGTQRSIVDLHTENDAVQHVLLQTRPMSLDVMYSHIQRLVMFVDAKLENRQYLFISVFASDNLHDWKCIISAQKKDTVLRHIRTNKAAKSYKDYVILINGVVSTDTDLSDLIADYTVVNRRLG